MRKDTPLILSIICLVVVSFVLGSTLASHPNPMVSGDGLPSEDDVMQENFDQMLRICRATSYYSAKPSCVADYLKLNGDYFCHDGLCCGGNTIGWYECFTPSK